MHLDLLHQRDHQRKAKAERLRLQTIERLRGVLAEVIPGAVVWVYGSLIQSGRFNQYSDIDLAVESKLGCQSMETLQSVLAESLGCRVDIGWLGESRLEQKIRCTGSRWTV